MPNPNTAFSSGAVYTADQANRFPRGLMAYNAVTTSDTTITAEEIQITAPAFTAVAGRLYRLTYYEPGFGGSAGAQLTMRIRLTNLAGAIQQQGIVYNNSFYQQNGIIVGYSTFSAGSVVLVGTCQQSAGTGTANRSATAFAVISVEDVGPT